MKTISYRTRGVCAGRVDVAIDGNVISSVRFLGGCSGNTQGVAALVVGMEADEAVRRLRGIRCGGKSTSCPDQLANAIEACLELSSDGEGEA
jgi:uncharacterized protein (TIGR03905 family)